MITRERQIGICMVQVVRIYATYPMCGLFFLNPEKEAKRARGGSQLVLLDDCPLWTPPASSGYEVRELSPCATASRGRTVTCTYFCLSVRRSPVRRRGAAGTLRSGGDVPSSPSGCRTTCKGSRAATLRWIPSALAEIHRNPEQPAPPNICGRYVCFNNDGGGPGENSVFVFTRRLWPLSTRESGF